MPKITPFPQSIHTEPESHGDFDEICALLAKYIDSNGRMGPEFCRFVDLLPQLRRTEDAALLREAKMIAGCLGRGKVNEGEAHAIVAHLGRHLPPLTAVPALHVMLGVLMFCAALLLLNAGLSYLWQTSGWSIAQAAQSPGFYLFNVSPWLIIAVASAGGLGSIVSILTRLDAFGGRAGTDRRLLWMIGAMRPVIGIALALFVFAVLQAPVLPFNFQPGPQANFEFVALAFIAGFSERFARGVIATVEGRFAGDKAQ
jgi:hypothetical protein